MYSIEIWYSPMPVPLSAACHSWLCTHYENETHRYEVIAKTNRNDITPLAGNLYKDFLPAEAGLRIFGLAPEKSGDRRFSAHLHVRMEGGVNSIAHQIYTFLHSDNVINYPYAHAYNMLIGPNSNTFTQWVINQFPDSGLTLPWNAYGKHYV